MRTPTRSPWLSLRARALAPALALGLAAAAEGCITLSSQHDALVRRVEVIERNDTERRRQLSDAVDNATRQVQVLNQQLEQARAQTRNLADLGARIDGLEEQLRQIQGGLTEVRRGLEAATTGQTELSTRVGAFDRRVLEIERRTGLAPAVDPNQIPNAPADIMAQANTAFTARDWVRARALCTALLQRAPQDALADDARLMLGRIAMQETRFATAVQEFQRLIQDYPTADTVPAALTDMAESFVRLGWCTQAVRTLRLLVERHGSTPQGQAARGRLEEVRRLPRGACTQ